MKSSLIAIAFGLLLIAACGTSPEENQNTKLVASEATTAKGKLFIIGGGKRPPTLVNALIDEAGLRNEGYVVVLPMSSSEPDTALYYGMQQFSEQGVTNVYGFNFNEGEEPSPSRIDSLKKAKLIYIAGGDQNKFMAVVAGNAIEKAIHECYQNGGTIAGTSAGAAVMSERMITGNEIKYPEYESTFKHIEAENIEIKKGLGLVKTAIIDQHFVIRSRHNRLISAAIEYPDLMGIGIDESTAIVVSGNTATVTGLSQVLVFKSNQPKTVKEGKLGTKGLTLDIYLPGESFPLQ